MNLFDDRELLREALDCPSDSRIIETPSDDWFYYENDSGIWRFFHGECFEFNELEIIADECLRAIRELRRTQTDNNQ